MDDIIFISSLLERLCREPELEVKRHLSDAMTSSLSKSAQNTLMALAISCPEGEPVADKSEETPTDNAISHLVWALSYQQDLTALDNGNILETVGWLCAQYGTQEIMAYFASRYQSKLMLAGAIGRSNCETLAALLKNPKLLLSAYTEMPDQLPALLKLSLAQPGFVRYKIRHPETQETISYAPTIMLTLLEKDDFVNLHRLFPHFTDANLFSQQIAQLSCQQKLLHLIDAKIRAASSQPNRCNNTLQRLRWFLSILLFDIRFDFTDLFAQLQASHPSPISHQLTRDYISQHPCYLRAKARDLSGRVDYENFGKQLPQAKRIALGLATLGVISLCCSALAPLYLTSTALLWATSFGQTLGWLLVSCAGVHSFIRCTKTGYRAAAKLSKYFARTTPTQPLKHAVKAVNPKNIQAESKDYYTIVQSHQKSLVDYYQKRPHNPRAAQALHAFFAKLVTELPVGEILQIFNGMRGQSPQKSQFLIHDFAIYLAENLAQAHQTQTHICAKKASNPTTLPHYEWAAKSLARVFAQDLAEWPYAKILPWRNHKITLPDISEEVASGPFGSNPRAIQLQRSLTVACHAFSFANLFEHSQQAGEGSSAFALTLYCMTWTQLLNQLKYLGLQEPDNELLNAFHKSEYSDYWYEPPKATQPANAR